MKKGRPVKRSALNGWKEISHFCGVSLITARRWGRRGMPHYKNPHVVAFREEIIEWIKSHKVSENDRK